MAEKNGMEMLSAWMGEQGQDALKMVGRLERLQRLMGSEAAPSAPKKEEADLFIRSQNEAMITAAIPFLNQEYQRDLYIVVRLMEMRRVLEGGLLETRERQEEPTHLRQRKLLRAVQEYLPAAEKGRMQTLLKMMDMREFLEREGMK